VPRFLADHNFRQQIVDGVVRRHPNLDIRTARSLDLARHSDEAMLEYAARSDLVILTHDHTTLVPAAWARVAQRQLMPGVVLIPALMPIGAAVNVLDDLIASLAENAWRDQVHRISSGLD
jgi:hypothetical protein